MKTLQATVIGLLLVVAATEADALNLKVREVRRSREAEALSITYEVENASVEAVRLERAELQLSDPLGSRLDVLPVIVSMHRLQRGEAALLRVRVPEARLREAALLTLRLYPSPPFLFPVREDVRVPPVEVRFEGPAAPRGLSPATRPDWRAPGRPGPWRLRLAGSILAPSGDAVLLLYALAGAGGPPETPAILEVRYSANGALLEARSIPVPAGRDGEAYLEVLLPTAVARRVDGIEARLFAASGEGMAVHPVRVEGHREQGSGAGAATASPVQPPPEARPALDPSQTGGKQPRPF